MSGPPAVVPPFGSEVIMLPIASALWGATCVQTFIYFLHFSQRDSFGTKLLVIWLWLADTVHIALSAVGVYFLSVTQWGNWAFLDGTSQEYLWSLMFTALVACSVQLFFARRVWIMSPGNPVAYILPLLAISQPVVYITFLILCYKNLAVFSLTLVNLLLAEWALSAATDVLIAITLLYLVWKLRSTTENSGLRSTNKLLERVVILTVNTGVWTGICSLFSIVTATVWKNSPAFTAVAFLICPLYCNTLLANLNMRETVRGNNFSAVSDMTFARATNRKDGSATQVIGAHSDDNDSGNSLTFEKTV